MSDAHATFVRACLTFGVPVFLAVAVACIPIAAALRRLGLVDRPNERSSHVLPTVRGGGLAIAAALLLGVPLQTSPSAPVAFLVGCFLVSAVSFADDLRPRSALLRITVHALGAAVFVVPLAFAGHPPPGRACLACACGMLFVVGYTNSFNFMDGINGLAAGQAVVTGLATAALALGAHEPAGSLPVALGLAVAFSAAGFLPHNFPRARMFMGDVGSATLGFSLAAAAVYLAARHGWVLAAELALLHSNFILDTAITLARRVLRGERWREAHREHFYQRLVRSGLGHAQATWLEMGIQIACSAAIVVGSVTGALPAWLLAAAVPAVWLAFFAYCERRFRQTTPSRV
jgi:UDP-N-acetylmuramyl pentapeptide phosphotransferase/UDP-N-acetylglucosamine-1-phosphate transferase